MLNFYLFPSKSKLDGSRSIPRSLQSSLSLESCPRNRSRIFEDFRGRGKRKNEKLLKRAAKPSPTFIINSTLSPMVFYAARWKPIFDEENRPPLPLDHDDHEEFVTRSCHDETRDFAVSSCLEPRADLSSSTRRRR